MSPSDSAAALRQAAETVKAALRNDRAGSLPDRDLQRLFALLVRAYACKRAEDAGFPPFTRQDEVTATDVAVTATGLLEAAEMAVFELGMWRTIKGRGQDL